jgi:hypothetical protein
MMINLKRKWTAHPSYLPVLVTLLEPVFRSFVSSFVINHLSLCSDRDWRIDNHCRVFATANSKEDGQG